MIVFLDFEASSLSKKSFPIEVAWVFEDGRFRSHLIKPAADWLDWSPEAEHVHGISRGMLDAEGTPVEAVAAEMMKELAGHDLYASAPSWDGKWLSVLLRATGHPRHALRLRKSDEIFLEAALSRTGRNSSKKDANELVSSVITGSEPASPAHRALPDARLELDRLKLVIEQSSLRGPTT
ncbi:transcriptional regulator [Rhizobium deserti]|uniref:Transcriptional regulator n=1 Tax=Rhizobium deserti TaxID=2547961 RepID=A0A4R5UAE0_9HYPH|nr:transcriptional regulator [Rhizobium deserti]TDK31770.1 transcriptional regulator [Rhizobium deserti]